MVAISFGDTRREQRGFYVVIHVFAEGVLRLDLGTVHTSMQSVPAKSAPHAKKLHVT